MVKLTDTKMGKESEKLRGQARDISDSIQRPGSDVIDKTEKGLPLNFRRFVQTFILRRRRVLERLAKKDKNGQ